MDEKFDLIVRLFSSFLFRPFSFFQADELNVIENRDK